jgi:hypothetical protein
LETLAVDCEIRQIEHPLLPGVAFNLRWVKSVKWYFIRHPSVYLKLNDEKHKWADGNREYNRRKIGGVFKEPIIFETHKKVPDSEFLARDGAEEKNDQLF